MASTPLADLEAGLTSWFSLKSRRCLTLGGGGGSVMFVQFLRKMSEPPPPAVVTSWCYTDFVIWLCQNSRLLG